MTVQQDRSARDALVQIDKVLQLEERKGYTDSSATIGLSRFVGERTGRLFTSARPETRRRLQELESIVADYSELSATERMRRVETARRLLGGLLGAENAGRTLAGEGVPASTRQVIPDRAPAHPARSPGSKQARRNSVPRAQKPRASSVTISSLADSVRVLPGVGDSRAKQLEQLGVQTIRDLLRLYPRRYNDYSNIQPIGTMLFGNTTTIQGVVRSVETTRTRTGKQLVDVVVADDTGAIHAVFFNHYVARQLTEGTLVSLSGRIEQMRGNLCLTNPEWEVLETETLNTGRIIPVYPLTKGLYQKTLRSLMRNALDGSQHLVQEHLPDDLRTAEGVISVCDAVEWIHFPDGPTPDAARQNLEAARARLAFDEFLVLQLGLVQRKLSWQSQPGNAIEINWEALKRFADALPYRFTRAQRRALKEILDDMARPQPMTRLLQGDVGSGKTIVAATAAVAAIQGGYQVALMAPTEILAEQHVRGLQQVFSGVPDDLRPRVGLLTGSVTGGERTTVYEGAADGSLDLVVGTHALIQGDVTFKRLGFAVIDEQHRFGVQQRALLRNKGENVDMLVMTATPIPRTLALTLHGDLDVSTLDELPPGRQAIETYRVPERKRADAYRFVREQVATGRQAFIVFPLVEESEAIDARAATAEYERLSVDVFPDLRLGLLHGRMRPVEKDAVMVQFRDGEIDILVSTSVVEVGIDVPNATVMLIDGAERFGLAQLHQFRGRVGRGAEKSYCLLLSGDPSQEGKARLQALVDSQDGFRLAQTDLELRGPGDFLGTRQSGLPELHLASLGDVRDLERARAVAERILEEDRGLSSRKYALLRARVEAFWQSAVTDVS